MAERGQILVVDDSMTARRKLSLAVTALGHQATEVSGGADALEALREECFDLVLLDILMPGIDGFEVLKQMKQDPQLREIPVLVVSGLENEPGAVIDAIRLGALDFLPKAFEPVLLKARVTAALKRKRNRDTELAENARINRLVEAAELLENSLVDSEHLGIADLAERNDAIGAFSRTFSGLASAMYVNERDKRRRIATRSGLVMLLTGGALFGLSAPLSKIASMDATNALGLTLWVSIITAALCLGMTAWRGQWPVWSMALVKFLVLLGMLGTALTDLLLFSATRHMPASTLSVLLALESFFVFGLSALLRYERAQPRRLLGLLIGLTGVLVIIQPGGGGSGINLWILLAVAAALGYAAEGLFVARLMPEDLDVTAVVGLAALVVVVVLLPIVLATGSFVSPFEVKLTTNLAIIAIAVFSMIATVIQTQLILRFGAVFTSQIAYVLTIAGVLWSMVLLGERLGASVWAALALLLVGMLLVEPKREPDAVLDVGVYGASKPAG